MSKCICPYYKGLFRCVRHPRRDRNLVPCEDCSGITVDSLDLNTLYYTSLYVNQCINSSDIRMYVCVVAQYVWVYVCVGLDGGGRVQNFNA